MCVDFINLNKTCPKDNFPLPSIDRLVNALAGYHVLNFMDDFFGYNQIMMDPIDQEKTAFIKKKGCIVTNTCHLDSRIRVPLTNGWSTNHSLITLIKQ